MNLSVKEKVRLRGEAMRLKAQLHLGKAGLTEGFCRQLDELLARDHLVKIRLESADRTARAALLEALPARVAADLIGTTGKTAVLYRAPAASAPDED